MVKAGGAGSDSFDVSSGVRQGCVLSPRLFAAVLQFVLKKGRAKEQHLGFGLGDGGPPLMDLRLADDLLLVASTRSAGLELLDALISELSMAGLILNDEKTKVITNEAQAPSSRPLTRQA